MIVNDDLSEDIEEMTLALSIPQDEIYCNAIYGGLTTTNLTIDDNDSKFSNIFVCHNLQHSWLGNSG